MRALCKLCDEQLYCGELCDEAKAEELRDDSENYSKEKYIPNPQPMTSYAESKARKMGDA